MSSDVYLWKTFRAQAEQHSGVSQKGFGFSPESVFAFIPECCSESARNPVRLPSGMLFALPGIRNRLCQQSLLSRHAHDGSLGVITTLEFVQHLFAKLGHRDLLTNVWPLPRPPRVASAAQAASFKRRRVDQSGQL
jgi:hypothetical protein